MKSTAGVHVREHRSLTASVEKRVLVWMAQRLSPRINSDHLSIVALLGMASAAISFVAIRYTSFGAIGVVVSLLVNWFGDSLDGTVARVRGHQRPRYGYYVDHVIDLAGTVLLLAGLACSGLTTPIVALALLASYLLVSAESYLATHAAGLFRMSFLGCGPTELRIVLAIGALRASHAPVISVGGWGPILLFDLGAIVGILGLGVAFLTSAWRNTCALYAAEPLPSRITSKAA